MDTHARMVGTWHPVRAELDGEQAPALVIERLIFVITSDGRYTMAFDGEVSDEGTIAHQEMDGRLGLLLQGTKGTNIGRGIPAIYQLQGDRLRICFGLDSVTPDAFQTSPGSGRYLVTYRRG